MLTPTQCLENVYSSIFRNAIRECLSIDHCGVVNTEINVPTQCASFIQHVICEPGSNLIDRMQDLGDRAGRHRYCTILECREEPAKMLSHLYRRHVI